MSCHGMSCRVVESLVASFTGPRIFSVTRKESHRAWYLKSSDQHTSLSGSKDGCFSLRFIGDFVSAVKSVAQTGCVEKLQEALIHYLRALLRIATALAHAHNYPSTTSLSWALRT